MRWVRSDLGTPALTLEVAALRCGLDAALWDDYVASGRCLDLLKAAPERDVYGNIRTESLPFDAVRAHALYNALFGQVEDLTSIISGRRCPCTTPPTSCAPWPRTCGFHRTTYCSAPGPPSNLRR